MMFASHVNTFTNYLIGGWQISPFLQLTSGSPSDISIASPGFGGPSVRPNLVNKGNLRVHPSPANNYDILNPCDFAALPPTRRAFTPRWATIDYRPIFGAARSAGMLHVFAEQEEPYTHARNWSPQK